jgi:hypothetical protein
MDLTMMERVSDRYEKMEGSCSTGQSPQWVVVPVEEEEEEEEEEEGIAPCILIMSDKLRCLTSCMLPLL